MTDRGMGVIFEPYDSRIERYPATDLLVSAARSFQPMAEHVFVPPTGWVNQRGASSCVSEAIMHAIHLRQAMMGLIPITPSDRDIYYRARASRHGYENVFDIGSNPVAGWEVVRPPRTRSGLGVVEYKDLPFDINHVSDPPDPYVYQNALSRDWVNYHWILPGGAKRGEQMDRLLLTGHPVTGSVTCDNHIEHWKPADGPWRFRGPFKGYHYLCFFHVDEDGNYWAIGTWGSEYGAAGFHLFAREEILSPRTSYLATPDIHR